MSTVHDIPIGDGQRANGATGPNRRIFGLGRPTINITPVERLGRIAIGLLAVVAGALLLAGAASVLAIVLEALLILAGLDLAVTGAFGHCPLYRKLGYVPKSLRRAS